MNSGCFRAASYCMQEVSPCESYIMQRAVYQLVSPSLSLITGQYSLRMSMLPRPAAITGMIWLAGIPSFSAISLTDDRSFLQREMQLQHNFCCSFMGFVPSRLINIQANLFVSADNKSIRLMTKVPSNSSSQQNLWIESSDSVSRSNIERRPSNILLVFPVLTSQFIECLIIYLFSKAEPRISPKIYRLFLFIVFFSFYYSQNFMNSTEY